MTRLILTFAALFLITQGVVLAQYEEEVAYDGGASSTSDSTSEKSMWQGGSLDFAYLPNHDGFGYKSVGADAKLGLPSFIEGQYVLVEPTFDYYDIGALASRNVANKKLNLYSTGGSLSYIVPYADGFVYDFSLGLTWNGDGKAHDSDSMKFTAMTGALVTSSDDLQWMFGIAYTDRSSWRVLPVVGVDWKPSDEWRYNLMFPKPKIERRIDFLPYDQDSSYWAYGGFTFGAFSGVFEPIAPKGQKYRTKAASIDYLDYRIMVGVERKAAKGIGWNAEVGTAFGGRYELESLKGTSWYEKRKPGANLFLKTGISF